jgi:hypothetical protein
MECSCFQITVFLVYLGLYNKKIYGIEHSVSVAWNDEWFLDMEGSDHAVTSYCTNICLEELRQTNQNPSQSVAGLRVEIWVQWFSINHSVATSDQVVMSL